MKVASQDWKYMCIYRSSVLCLTLKLLPWGLTTAESFQATWDNGHWRLASCCQGAVFKKSKHGGGAVGLKKKIPQWVSKFLAGSVGPHYSSLPDSSLRGPTGSTLIDRYILRNHWHEKRRNPAVGGEHLQSFFFFTKRLKPQSWKPKAAWLINLHFALIFMCI